MNRIPIEGTNLFLWADSHQWIIGKMRKVKVTKDNPSGLKATDCTYHCTVAQAVREVFGRVSRDKCQKSETLSELASSYNEAVGWIKNLFPDIKKAVN